MQNRRFPYVRIIFYFILFMSLLIIKDAGLAKTNSGQKAYIDIHMHFSNQLTRNLSRKRRGVDTTSQGFQYKDFITCAENMIELMDRFGVQKALVMPQPRLSGQKGYYDYKKLLPAVKKYPDRLFLGGGGGILNSMIHSIDPSQVTDEICAQFKEKALSMVEDGAKVLGELAALHVSLNPNHVYEEVTPDHPLFLLLADIAAEHNTPIDIHMEAVVKDSPIPDNLSKISSENPATLKANIPAFERLLKHNRKAKIIWQHIGWDNIGQMTISLLRRMLEDHPNLFCGFKIEDRHYQIGTRQPISNRMVDENMKIKADWLQFFKDFADRLLVGSDEFIGIPGKTQRSPQSFEETWNVMKQLPTDVINKVGRNNAAKLYNLER